MCHDVKMSGGLERLSMPSVLQNLQDSPNSRLELKVDHEQKHLLRKTVRAFAITLSMAAILLFVLRTVYAISLFRGVTDKMKNSGWADAGTNSVVDVNEEMTFEASYLIFKIGAVRFQVLEKTTYDSVPAYRLRAYIDSYSGIPFVDLHAVYDTYADAGSLTCLFTSNSQREDNGWVYTSTLFDTNRKILTWMQSKNGEVIKKVDCPLDKNYTDGLSFVYYLREACRNADGRKTHLVIPVAVDTLLSSIDITVDEAREACDVKAFDFPLDAYRLSGHMNFKGFFGVSGDFVGWMSADPDVVPLRANVKVILGSVVVKLKDIRKNNWTPPRSSSN